MASMSKQRRKELEKLETRDSKYCTRCKKVKPLVEFGVNAKRRKFANTYCLDCVKENNTFRTYGITLKDYDKMLEEQGDKCKICKTKVPGGHGRFHVDHDHLTNKIRGLLCMNCNHMLGCCKDDIETLATAIQYLTDSRK